jgi:hypothetical protein
MTVGYLALLIIVCLQTLDLRKTDVFTRNSFTFDFLTATSIVVSQQGVLEVYEIRTETPGAPPVHTASFRMPRPNLDELFGSPGIHVCRMVLIMETSRTVRCFLLLSGLLRTIRILPSSGIFMNVTSAGGWRPNSMFLYLPSGGCVC